MKPPFLSSSLAALAIGLVSCASVANAQSSRGLTDDAIRADASVGVSAQASAQPIVVTHEDVVATFGADTDASSTGEYQASSTSGGASASSSTSEELRAHATALARADAKVSAVNLSPERVSLSYKEPAKVFGLISVDVPVSVSVDATGSTTVSYPWYSFLLATDHAALAIRAQAAADNTIAAEGATSTVVLSAAAQARLLDSIYAVLQAGVTTD